MTQTVIVGNLTKLPFSGNIIDGIEHVAIEIEADIMINGKETGRKRLFTIQFKNKENIPNLTLGRIVGIKGHLDAGSCMGFDGSSSQMMYIVCDKITML